MLKKLKQIVPHNFFVRRWYSICSSHLAALFLPLPKNKLKLIGITGTDGKTTTVEMARHILDQNNITFVSSSSLAATLNGKKLFSSKRTTPSAWQLRKLLRQAILSGAEVGVIEVSSHSLVQQRVCGLKFAVAVITNITSEHLDYHGSREAYVAAKELIYKKYLANDGVVLREPWQVEGDYNAKNAMAAAQAIAAVSDLLVDDGLKTLASFKGVKGRMQEIKAGQKFKVIVDFALTANALELTIQAVRKGIKQGRVILVFGATGGQHDHQKRPALSQAATTADVVIVTDDEPYEEDSGKIRQELITEINTEYHEIADRRDAIAKACQLAKAEDVVLITGMGHHQSRNIGGQEIKWNDAEVVKEELLKIA